MDVPAGVAINAHKAGLRRNHPLQVSTSGASHRTELQPDAIEFKDQLESCLKLFRNLIEAMVRSTKESTFAGSYFHSLVRQLDNELVRIEIWASDVGAYEPDFGRSTQVADIQLELTRYITTILKGLQSRLENSAKQVDKMQSLIEKLSGSRLKNLKLDRQLRTCLAQFEKEYQEVNLAIRSILNLTEAFQMEQAVKLQSGPLAGIRQRHLETREINPETSPPIPRVAIGEPLANSVGVSASEDLGPWSGKTLLSFDGGGTKILSAILILKALMAEIAVQEQTILPQAPNSASPLPVIPRAVEQQTGTQRQRQLQLDQSRYLPCHYFDYIAGTSFGGLIAVMLSRLRMSVDECFDEFQNLLRKVLGQFRILNLRARTFWPRDKYDYRKFMRDLKDLVKRGSPNGNENETFRQHNEDRCRCIVMSFLLRDGGTVAEGLYLFRSYHHPTVPTNDPMLKLHQRNPDHPRQYTIWEVVRAATAVPTYFAPMILGKGTEANEYIDAGFGAYNPSLEAYYSVRGVSGKAPQMVVSVGSGANRRLRPQSTSVTTSRTSSTGLEAEYAERAHLELTELESKKELNYYARLNVEEGIGDMKLDEWRGKHGRDTLMQIVEKTEDYLRSDSVKKSIIETARILVETRRARAFDPDSDHWERFCHGVEYVCIVFNCTDKGKIHRKRRDLRCHLEDVHHIRSSEIETVLDRGKRFPLYDVNSKAE